MDKNVVPYLIMRDKVLWPFNHRNMYVVLHPLWVKINIEASSRHVSCRSVPWLVWSRLPITHMIRGQMVHIADHSGWFQIMWVWIASVLCWLQIRLVWIADFLCWLQMRWVCIANHWLSLAEASRVVTCQVVPRRAVPCLSKMMLS